MARRSLEASQGIFQGVVSAEQLHVVGFLIVDAPVKARVEELCLARSGVDVQYILQIGSWL